MNDRDNDNHDDDDFELPDPREINRKISQEAKLAKARDERTPRHVGAWAHLLDSACSKKRENDVAAQIGYLYDHGDLWAGTGGDRVVGHETETKHRKTMPKVLKELSQTGKGVKDIRSLSRKHVIAAIKYWIKNGLKAPTIQGKISVLRRFFCLIGKPTIMPGGQRWTKILRSAGVDTDYLKRDYVARESKAWADAGVDVLAKIEQIWAESPACGAGLMFMVFSGARVREAFSDSPMTMDCGDFLRLEKGTKGKRKREVRLDITEEELTSARAMLERVKAVADQCPRKVLNERSTRNGRWLNLKQMRRRFYTVMEKHGITLAKDGVTPHGLRHGFLHQRYEAISGLPPPVLRLAPAEAYEENAAAVGAAKEEVSTAAGHARDASYFYTGNKIRMTKEAKKCEQAMLARIGSDHAIAAAFERFMVINAWLVGRIAYGVKLGLDQALEVHVLLPPSQVGAAAELQAVMEAALGRFVTVTSSFDPMRRPEVGSEIVFDHQRDSHSARRASN